ncbi:MAG: FKBP-type peptidyl-prolyl cis-trans isomerase [Bacteroidales bacterium]|jgi:FKBP-type peptidyl-prolyl cis-trans isomerase|nr:FKBP-type peptidyl-prolyl cis-trans isomerase [Bacteroidales bacterium]
MTGKSRYTIFVIITVLVVVSAGCDISGKYEKEEAAEIQNYLNSHPELNYEQKASGLYYLDEEVGTGELAVTSDTAYFFYSGYYLDGTKFATNWGTTDTLVYPVNERWLISGFDEALTYMREGGKSKIVVPSKLGYYDYHPLLYDIFLARLVPGPGADGK